MASMIGFNILPIMMTTTGLEIESLGRWWCGSLVYSTGELFRSCSVVSVSLTFAIFVSLSFAVHHWLYQLIIC